MLTFDFPIANRFEAFNSLIRTQNIYGNCHSPSKDFVLWSTSGLCVQVDYTMLPQQRGMKCKKKHLMLSLSEILLLDVGKHLNHYTIIMHCVQQFVNHLPPKETLSKKAIYNPGCLREVSQ